MEYFTSYGYIGLFLSAFLAATILPLSSEGVLVWMLANDFQSAAVVSVASAGNVLGAFTNYYLGFKGNDLLLQKVLRMSPEEMSKAEIRFNKYGVYSLLLAWAPFIGDPLTVVAGLFKVNLLIFGVLVFIGKFGRYLFLAFAVEAL